MHRSPGGVLTHPSVGVCADEWLEGWRWERGEGSRGREGGRGDERSHDEKEISHRPAGGWRCPSECRLFAPSAVPFVCLTGFLWRGLQCGGDTCWLACDRDSPCTKIPGKIIG